MKSPVISARCPGHSAPCVLDHLDVAQRPAAGVRGRHLHRGVPRSATGGLLPRAERTQQRACTSSHGRRGERAADALLPDDPQAAARRIHELRLRHTRDSSWEFTRDGLVQISVAAGEEYSDLNALATILTAFPRRVGLPVLLPWGAGIGGSPDFTARHRFHGCGGFAAPRKVSTRASLGDQRWTADQMPARRRGCWSGQRG